MATTPDAYRAESRNNRRTNAINLQLHCRDELKTPKRCAKKYAAPVEKLICFVICALNWKAFGQIFSIFTHNLRERVPTNTHSHLYTRLWWCVGLCLDTLKIKFNPRRSLAQILIHSNGFPCTHTHTHTFWHTLGPPQSDWDLGCRKGRVFLFFFYRS